jgi:hypothetical protein
LFTRNGSGGVADYRREITHGTLDLTTSQVFGWVSLAQTSADESALVYPGQRGELVRCGRQAAEANGIE